jgi:hypothetical protein
MIWQQRSPMSDDPTEGRSRKRRKKRRVSETDMSLFLRQYGRKARRGYDPNDRSYSRDVEKKIKRMKPEDVDLLMRGEVSDTE